MGTWQIVLFCILGAGVLSIIAAKIIGKSLKNKKDPNFRPVLNKKEKLISLISVVIGIGLIVGGIFLQKPDGGSEATADLMMNIEGEGADPEKEEMTDTEGEVWVGETELGAESQAETTSDTAGGEEAETAEGDTKEKSEADDSSTSAQVKTMDRPALTQEVPAG